MSDAPFHCATGCRIDRLHQPGCDGPPCRGCLPRPPDIGTLCRWCWQRLNGDIVDAPALARYLWAVAHSGETTTAAEPVDGGVQPSERSVLHGALDALDELHATLSSWARLILEEHPDGATMRGPDETGARYTLSTIREFDGETFVRAPEVAGVRDPEATSRLVRWLLPHLTWCAGQEWAAEMRREVATVVRTTAARYPVEERTRAIPGITCTACERVSLTFDPATPERPTTQVTCSTRGCGIIYSEDDFRRLARMVEWEHGQKREESA